MKTARILHTGDWHCGHRAGLTPPEWWSPEARPVWRDVQSQLWNWWTEQIDHEVETRGRFDVLVINGDAIDGDGKKSGGQEQICVSPADQIEMAVTVAQDLIKRAMRDGGPIIMTYGTPYHTGQGSECEGAIAAQIGADIAGTQVFDVMGQRFNVRHHSGKSSIPYGMNPVAKELMWERDKCAISGDKTPDVMVRNHVHEYRAALRRGAATIQAPAMQLPDSIFGDRCSGGYDVGFMVFEVTPEGATHRCVLADLPQVRQRQHGELL